MRRLLTAAVVAAPVLLAGPAPARANHPCNYGYGCGGFCFRLFQHIHQHGPLFNYGPYYGYPPFEPYGPWNPYLQYTGPVGPVTYGGGGGHGHHGHVWAGNPHPLCKTGVGGLFHFRGKAGHKADCASCGDAAAAAVTAGPALDRYTGHGHPAAAEAFYAGGPALGLAPVTTVGFRYW